MTGPEDSFGLTLQSLPDTQSRVLVVGRVVEMRSGARSFSPSDVRELFGALRVPAPAKVSNVLESLRRKELVLSLGLGQWALTPVGLSEADRVAGTIDVRRLELELAGHPGAQLADELHPLILPAFAPPRWRLGIARLLNRFPLERNVFCMTRYPRDDDDPLVPVIDRTRAVLKDHGLFLHLASDRQAEDELFGNVAAFMWACQYGVGLLEDRRGLGLNYNVVLELGSMIVTGRRCTMLRDVTAPALPTDLSGQIYKGVDFADLDSVGSALESWVREDLSL